MSFLKIFVSVSWESWHHLGFPERDKFFRISLNLLKYLEYYISNWFFPKCLANMKLNLIILRCEPFENKTTESTWRLKLSLIKNYLCFNCSTAQLWTYPSGNSFTSPSPGNQQLLFPVLVWGMFYHQQFICHNIKRSIQNCTDLVKTQIWILQKCLQTAQKKTISLIWNMLCSGNIRRTRIRTTNPSQEI